MRAATTRRWRGGGALAFRLRPGPCIFPVLTGAPSLHMTSASSPCQEIERLPPAAMQPQPLIRILANPCFDHGCDGLRRPGNVDPPVAVARGRDRFGQFG